jgi:hypothetical protein
LVRKLLIRYEFILTFPFNRVPRKRNYDEEAKRNKLEASTTENHPLKTTVDILTPLSSSKDERKSSIKCYTDPLSELVNQDPLSKMVADVTLKEKVNFLKIVYLFLNFKGKIKIIFPL